MKRLVICMTSGVVLGLAVLLSAQESLPGFFRVEVASINPWTSLRFQGDPENFQFAVVTDRTGGHRSMVFQKAVRKLNTLRPEFVVSVGDLIEGYTEDRAQVEKEWKEFDGFVRQLQMPFFYTPGNHDISNRFMERLWNDRYGRPYYHFVYRNVLFLIVNSEATLEEKGEPAVDRLGEEQLESLGKVLAANRDVRWTFLFLHKPLWSYGKDRMGEGTGWPELEQHLQGRRFTAFCGHHHRYYTWRRNGNDYIQLATTGGASKMRGKEYGEFDQITWVTMTQDGPQIAHLLLDGILDMEVVEDLAYDRRMAEAQEVQRQEREAEKQRREAAKAKEKTRAKEKVGAPSRQP